MIDRNFKINRGVELMMREERQKEQKEKKPKHGFGINKMFSLLKRKVYFNFEFRWDKEI